MTYFQDKPVNNLNTFEFRVPKNIFYNSSLNLENKGFCDDDCLGNGVFNVSKCIDGTY